MSGHSKWSTIKRKKAKIDSARAAEFQKFSTTFKECAKLISDRSRKIDSDEAQLKSRIASANPLE